MQAAEAIATTLLAEGVEVFFGLIGGGVEEVARALVDSGKVRFVKVRHEDAAVAMADGYSRTTGKIGVALIDGSPGLANASPALIAARMSASRVIVLVPLEAHPNRWDFGLPNRHVIKRRARPKRSYVGGHIGDLAATSRTGSRSCASKLRAPLTDTPRSVPCVRNSSSSAHGCNPRCGRSCCICRRPSLVATTGSLSSAPSALRPRVALSSLPISRSTPTTLRRGELLSSKSRPRAAGSGLH